MEKNKKVEGMKIGLYMSKMPEDMAVGISNLINKLEKAGVAEVIEKSVKRVCDNCGREIKKGDKFKGSGVEEYCSDCSKTKKIKGNYKVNNY